MPLFKKKGAPPPAPELPPELAGLPASPQPPQLPPLAPGISQAQIRNLTARGYPAPDLLAGVQAAGLQPAGPPPTQPPIPAPPLFRPAPAPAPAARPPTAEIEEIAEAIIAERWQRAERELDELKRAQEDLSASLSGLSERMSNLEKKMDMVIAEVLGKVEEYGKGIADVGTELKAMQKVFGTMLPTFTENIKELQELVGAAKEKGFRKGRARG